MAFGTPKWVKRRIAKASHPHVAHTSSRSIAAHQGRIKGAGFSRGSVSHTHYSPHKHRYVRKAKPKFSPPKAPKLAHFAKAHPSIRATNPQIKRALKRQGGTGIPQKVHPSPGLTLKGTRTTPARVVNVGTGKVSFVGLKGKPIGRVAYRVAKVKPEVLKKRHPGRAAHRIQRRVLKKLVKKTPTDTRGLTAAEKAVVPIVKQAAKKYGEPAALLMSQIRQESGFQAGQTSSAGAQGITQFIPSTAKAYGVKFGTSKSAIRSQIMGQAHYMADLGVKKDPTKALTNYSGGYSVGAYAGPIQAGAKDYKGVDRGGIKVNRAALARARRLGVPERKLKAKVRGGAIAQPISWHATVKKLQKSGFKGRAAHRVATKLTHDQRRKFLSGKVEVLPGGGGYGFPFSKSMVKMLDKTKGRSGWWGRTDAGVDFETGSPSVKTVAIGRAKVLQVQTGVGGYGKFVTYKLLDGPKRGRVVFVGHGEPLVKAGQTIKRGQAVASAAGYGASPGHLEIGWATSSGSQARAFAKGTFDPSSHHSPQGEHFNSFIQRVEKHPIGGKKHGFVVIPKTSALPVSVGPTSSGTSGGTSTGTVVQAGGKAKTLKGVKAAQAQALLAQQPAFDPQAILAWFEGKDNSLEGLVRAFTGKSLGL